jgi:DNA repair exonuclease SbcCD nuclease subunit
MKIALINDTHFGARNDSKVFDDYFYEFYDQIFFPYLLRNNIKTVVHLGDIVDRRKFINYKILRNFKTKFVKRFSDMGIDFHVIIGNHDTFFKNTNEINSMTELFDNGELTNQISIYTGPEEMLFDGTKILMVPWINDGNRKESMRLLEESNAEIILGHLEVKGFAMMLTGGINEHGLDASAFNRFDMAMSGHFHHKSDNGTVYYLGAPYEMTWADYQDPRGFHIFDTETRGLEHIRNPYKMFHKIVYDDTDKTSEEVVQQDFTRYENTHVKVVVQNKTNPYWFDLMLDELYNANPYHVSIVEDFSDAADTAGGEINIDQAEDTLTILRNYVDDLGVKEDSKSELNELLHGLYLEAVSMETE